MSSSYKELIVSYFEDNLFQDIESALKECPNGGIIKVRPGDFSGINISSIDKIFNYEIIGSGIATFLNSMIHEGFINSKITDCKITNIKIQSHGSIITFTNVNFQGGGKLSCKQFLNNINLDISNINTLEFVNCRFGINFVINIQEGKYRLDFKNCHFTDTNLDGNKGNPIIYVKNGECDINLSQCNYTRDALVYNKNGMVYINHTNCILTNYHKLWDGKPCVVSSRDDELRIAEIKTFPSLKSSEFYSPLYFSEDSDNFIALDINTDNLESLDAVDIFPCTTFVNLYGSKIIILKLPSESCVRNGHLIEILNNIKDNFYVILNHSEKLELDKNEENDRELQSKIYTSKILRIRRVYGSVNNWVIY